MIFHPFADSQISYLNGLTALSVGVLCGIGFDHWATILYDFAILEDDLTLDACLDLLGGSQFGGGFLDDLLCVARKRLRLICYTFVMVRWCIGKHNSNR